MPRTPSTTKRRRAWTLTITAALLAVVWVGSMKVGVGFQSTQGSAYFRWGALNFYRYSPDLATDPDVWLMENDRWRVVWLFHYSYDTDSYAAGLTRVGIVAPLWPFVLLTGVPGVWMMVKTRKRTNPHACPACGYDRTGLPQTSTSPAPCPECGKT